MASRKPYECFKCRDNEFPNTRVYLAGKDEQGRTKYLNEDGTKHFHKTNDQQHQETLPPTIEHIHNLLAVIDGKLDRLLNLAERK